jgi:endonuclease YncB( thermonuclease family)
LALKAAPNTRRFPAIVLLLIGRLPPGKLHLIRAPEIRGPPQPTPKKSSEKQLRLRVVGVHDGDTLTGLDESKTQFKVRLDMLTTYELIESLDKKAKAKKKNKK